MMADRSLPDLMPRLGIIPVSERGNRADGYLRCESWTREGLVCTRRAVYSDRITGAPLCKQHALSRYGHHRREQP